MEEYKLGELGDEWKEVEATIAFRYGGGSDKKLYANVRFDGHGNVTIRFIVKGEGKETSYEKFDAAAYNFNRLP